MLVHLEKGRRRVCTCGCRIVGYVETVGHAHLAVDQALAGT